MPLLPLLAAIEVATAAFGLASLSIRGSLAVAAAINLAVATAALAIHLRGPHHRGAPAPQPAQAPPGASTPLARALAVAALAAARRALLVGSVAGFAFLPASGRIAALGLAPLLLTLAFVFVVAAGFGVLLPTVAHLGVGADDRAGMRTAQLCLANILGSATGSVATGFVLLDRLPLASAAAALVAAGLALAALLDALSAGARRARLARPAALLAAGAVAAAALPHAAEKVLERLL